jgi:hypothetical protein
MQQFTKLRALREKLASIPSHLVDAETRASLVDAIRELDDAMVMDQRAADIARLTNNATVDMVDFYTHTFGGMAVTS